LSASGNVAVGILGPEPGAQCPHLEVFGQAQCVAEGMIRIELVDAVIASLVLAWKRRGGNVDAS